MGTALASLGYDPNTTDENEIKEAAELLMKIKDNIKVFDGDSPRKELLNGECSAGFLYGGDLTIAMMQEPDKFGVAQIDTGYNVGTQQFCIPTGSPHKKLAEQFINYIHEPKVMAQITEVYPYVCVNKGAMEFVTEEYKNCTSLNLDESLKKNLWELKDVGDAITIYDQYWSEFMAE